MTGFRRILRPPAGRITNQTLLVALVLVFGTGVATVAIGSYSCWPPTSAALPCPRATDTRCAWSHPAVAGTGG